MLHKFTQTAQAAHTKLTIWKYGNAARKQRATCNVRAGVKSRNDNFIESQWRRYCSHWVWREKNHHCYNKTSSFSSFSDLLISRFMTFSFTLMSPNASICSCFLHIGLIAISYQVSTVYISLLPNDFPVISFPLVIHHAPILYAWTHGPTICVYNLHIVNTIGRAMY